MWALGRKVRLHLEWRFSTPWLSWMLEIEFTMTKKKNNNWKKEASLCLLFALSKIYSSIRLRVFSFRCFFFGIEVSTQMKCDVSNFQYIFTMGSTMWWLVKIFQFSHRNLFFFLFFIYISQNIDHIHGNNYVKILE